MYVCNLCMRNKFFSRKKIHEPRQMCFKVQTNVSVTAPLFQKKDFYQDGLCMREERYSY